MNYVKALLTGCFLLIELTLMAQSALLHDPFGDETVDEALWTVVRPYTAAPRSTVTETNGNLILFRRGIVEAAGAFPVSLDMEGKFRFTGDNDVLSIVFRSDLTVTNQFERRGVQVALQESTAKVFLVGYAGSMIFAAVYLDHHWLIDAVVGVAYAIALWLVVRAIQRRKTSSLQVAPASDANPVKDTVIA